MPFVMSTAGLPEKKGTLATGSLEEEMCALD